MTFSATIARGDALPVTARSLPSPLPGVSPDAWSALVRALCAGTGVGVGVFAIRPRRLCDLGVMVREGDLSFRFGTEEAASAFLGSPLAQYNALVRSLALYDRDLRVPDGFTRSGALGVLHSAGPGALRNWARGPRGGLRGDIPADRAEAVFSRTNGIF